MTAQCQMASAHVYNHNTFYPRIMSFIRKKGRDVYLGACLIYPKYFWKRNSKKQLHFGFPFRGGLTELFSTLTLFSIDIVVVHVDLLATQKYFYLLESEAKTAEWCFCFKASCKSNFFEAWRERCCEVLFRKENDPVLEQSHWVGPDLDSFLS